MQRKERGTALERAGTRHRTGIGIETGRENSADNVGLGMVAEDRYEQQWKMGARCDSNTGRRGCTKQGPLG